MKKNLFLLLLLQIVKNIDKFRFFKKIDARFIFKMYFHFEIMNIGIPDDVVYSHESEILHLNIRER